MECPVPDAGDAVRDRDAGQLGTTVERRVSDSGDTVRNCIVVHVQSTWVLNKRGLILIKHNTTHAAVTRIAGIHRNHGQVGTRRKRTRTDTGDATANEDIGQTGAAHESRYANAGDAIGYNDASQIGARIECIGFDAGDAIGNGEITIDAPWILDQRGLVLII